MLLSISLLTKGLPGRGQSYWHQTGEESSIWVITWKHTLVQPEVLARGQKAPKKIQSEAWTVESPEGRSLPNHHPSWSECSQSPIRVRRKYVNAHLHRARCPYLFSINNPSGELKEQFPSLPQRLTRSPVGGAVCGGLGWGALLEKECHWRRALRVWSLSLLHVCSWDEIF